VTEEYLARARQTPCRCFERSKTSQTGKYCPHGNQCHFAHRDENGEQYVFSPTELSANVRRRESRRARTDLGEMLWDTVYGLRMVAGTDAVRMMRRLGGNPNDYDYDEDDSDDLWGGLDEFPQRFAAGPWTVFGELDEVLRWPRPRPDEESEDEEDIPSLVSEEGEESPDLPGLVMDEEMPPLVEDGEEIPPLVQDDDLPPLVENDELPPLVDDISLPAQTPPSPTLDRPMPFLVPATPALRFAVRPSLTPWNSTPRHIPPPDHRRPRPPRTSERESLPPRGATFVFPDVNPWVDLEGDEESDVHVMTPESFLRMLAAGLDEIGRNADMHEWLD
jgi:hypothetical protein